MITLIQKNSEAGIVLPLILYHKRSDSGDFEALFTSQSPRPQAGLWLLKLCTLTKRLWHQRLGGCVNVGEFFSLFQTEKPQIPGSKRYGAILWAAENTWALLCQSPNLNAQTLAHCWLFKGLLFSFDEICRDFLSEWAAAPQWPSRVATTVQPPGNSEAKPEPSVESSQSKAGTV